MRWPARRRLGSGFWLCVSLLVHAAILLAIYLVPAQEPQSDADLLIPVTLLPETETPEPAPEPAPRTLLRFRRARTPAVREDFVIPRLDVAVAPPPPDAVLEPEAAGGGFDAGRVVPSALAGFTLEGTGGGRAGRGAGAGSGVGTEGSFQDYVGNLRQVGLDVVFVIDATGSMGWLIREVKDRVRALAASIRRLVPVTRFGVVAFRDDDDPEFLVRVQPLTLSVARVRRFLDRLEARGGGDIPEAVDAGLDAAIREADWAPDAKRVIILIGDAPPHPARLAQALELARGFAAAGGTVSAVDVSFDANPTLAAARLHKRVDELTTVVPRGVLPDFRAIAAAGAGDSSTLEGERRIVRRLAVLIFGERWAEDVQPLLGDL